MGATIDERQEVHTLVDHLRPAQLTAVRHLLHSMVDPIAHSIAVAPLDDEPLTPEDFATLDRAMEWFKHNEGTPQEEVLAEFGLKMEDFPLRENDL